MVTQCGLSVSIIFYYVMDNILLIGKVNHENASQS